MRLPAGSAAPNRRCTSWWHRCWSGGFWRQWARTGMSTLAVSCISGAGALAALRFHSRSRSLPVRDRQPDAGNGADVPAQWPQIHRGTDEGGRASFQDFFGHRRKRAHSMDGVRTSVAQSPERSADHRPDRHRRLHSAGENVCRWRPFFGKSARPAKRASFPSIAWQTPSPTVSPLR